MTGTLAPTLPTIGEPNSTEDPKVRASIVTLRDGLNAILKSDNTVDFSAVPAGDVGTYKWLLSTGEVFSGGTTAATYLLLPGATSAVTSGTNFSGAQVPELLYFDDADYLVSGYTEKLRVRAQASCNATAPAITFTVGFYPVTVAGTATNLAYTLGTVVSGSTVAMASPSASTITQGNSGDFTVPADGAYVLGVVLSGTAAANSRIAISTQLQVHCV